MTDHSHDRRPPALRRTCLSVLGLLIAAAVAPPAPAASNSPAPYFWSKPQVKVRRAYVDMHYGQLHYLAATPPLPESSRKRTLILFHQSPLSSAEMAAFAAEMGTDRLVIAIDTPGQGNSDGPDQVPTIADYAEAIDEGLHRLGFDADHPVDILGNHTGAFVAAELAILEPRMVKRVVMAGVYVVAEERRLKAVAGLSHPANSAEFYDQLCRIMPVLEKYYGDQGIDDEVWGKVVASSVLPLTRREYGHEAAFAYAATAPQRLAKLIQPVLLLAMNDGIGGPTKDSARYFAHADLKELPDFKEGAFTMHAPELGAIVRAWLD